MDHGDFPLKQPFSPALLIGLIFMYALPSFAAERYFSVTPGVWLPYHTSTIYYNLQPINSSYSAGWSLGGAVGASFDNGLRIENELVYRQASARGMNDDQWNLGWLVNLWWEGRNSTRITPYFGGGVGFGRGHVASPVSIDNSGSGIAYQAGGGFGYRIHDNVSLDLGYRYFGITDSSSNNIGGIELAGSSWVAGLRMRF